MTGQKYPEPTVGIFIFNPSADLLLLRSHKWPGKYVVPGGHVELGESLAGAVVREAREETGLDVHELKFICIQESIHDPSFWKHRHFIFFDYTCRADSLEVKLNDEAEEHLWIAPREALELPLDAYTRRALEMILKEDLS